MTTKVLPNSFKIADGGKVECEIVSNEKVYRGVIEQSFFEDFFGNQPANTQQKLKATEDNMRYFAQMAEKQINEGEQTVVIR